MGVLGWTSWDSGGALVRFAGLSSGAASCAALGANSTEGFGCAGKESLDASEGSGLWVCGE